MRIIISICWLLYMLVMCQACAQIKPRAESAAEIYAERYAAKWESIRFDTVYMYPGDSLHHFTGGLGKGMVIVGYAMVINELERDRQADTMRYEMKLLRGCDSMQVPAVKYRNKWEVIARDTVFMEKGDSLHHFLGGTKGKGWVSTGRQIVTFDIERDRQVGTTRRQWRYIGSYDTTKIKRPKTVTITPDQFGKIWRGDSSNLNELYKMATAEIHINAEK